MKNEVQNKCKKCGEYVFIDTSNGLRYNGNVLFDSFAVFYFNRTGICSNCCIKIGINVPSTVVLV